MPEKELPSVANRKASALCEIFILEKYLNHPPACKESILINQTKLNSTYFAELFFFSKGKKEKHDAV